MPRLPKPPRTAKSVGGIKYFRKLLPLLERLHEVGTDRDRAGNRQFHFDHYVALLLLYFFNPTLTSLRSLPEASGLAKVQKKLGIPRTSLGSLSEAARVFDPAPLQAIVAELAGRALPLERGREAEVLRGLTAVDGSLLPALPKMAWALWVDDTHRAAKLHLHFDVFKGVPCSATITSGNGNEKQQLRQTLQADRLYVVDRGYAEYRLFQEIIDANSSFIGRVRDNAVATVVEERPLSAEAKTAGVLRDDVVHLGCETSGAVFRQPLRLIEVATGTTDANGHPEVLRLASNCLDLDAAWIALGYRFRWTVELFFRWFKCILGCQHLLSHSQAGVAIQVYVALIASLVITLWTGHKPTKRTFEMICHYFAGWATEAELLAHIRKLDAKRDQARSKKA